ncbi:MAG: DNA alkylation response protein, partial [Limnobacter sp.]
MKTAKELQANPIVGETHQVHNVASELHSYNLFTTDAALLEGVQREGGTWGVGEISAFGEKCGKPEYLELGFLANKYTPELDTHDRFGTRVDSLRYHSAYHELMKSALEEGLHSQPWTNPREGA